LNRPGTSFADPGSANEPKGDATMHHSLFLGAAAVAALSLAACNKPAANNPNASQGAQTGNPGQTAPVNAAQDATAAAVGQTSAATLGSHDTGAFVDNLGQGNMYEVQAAQIAQKKAKSADVKAFAKMMVTDHTAMLNEMKPLVTAAGKTMPTSLDQRRKGLIDNLNAASAADFDKTYIDQQVAAHEETLTLLNGYAQNGDDAGLKALAAKAVPKVQAHLDKAKQIQASLSGAAPAGATAPPKK
jgi:putative membrane protein